MRRLVPFAIAAIASLAGLCLAVRSGFGQDADQFTPVLASPISPETAPAPGTDGKFHLVYELMLTNAISFAATLDKIEVIDARCPSRVLATLQGGDLLSRLRVLLHQPAADTQIEPGSARLVFLDLVFASRADVPRRLLHRLTLHLDAKKIPQSLPSQMTCTVAPFEITPDVPVIGPPLAGKGWVAADSCDTSNGAHRGAVQLVNSKLYNSQRFAIDWIRLDENGRYLHGDPTDVQSYTGYGDPILAVADSTVIDTRNDLENAKPPNSPDPSTITLQNALGNHVILDIGGGYFAFYAHLQKGSVLVKPGERVKRGQALGRVGNSGNTTAPHLHFHIMNGPTVFSSDGLPYAIDRFELAGQIPAEQWGDFTVPYLEKDFNPWRSGPPVRRRNQYPLNYTIINFPPLMKRVR
jgi:hypothetical protein